MVSLKEIPSSPHPPSFQLGCDVPAQHFSLSPCDRIFVRMGARDSLMTGRSTFLVELQETAVMLVRHVAVTA